MNTTEIIIKNSIKSYDEFYQRMKEQFIAYEKIEGISDWGKYDFSIDCSEDQMKFKDMLQIRFIEELTEASEARDEENLEHFKEEITDAINFFMSAYIMTGIDLNKFTPIKNIIKESLYFKCSKVDMLNYNWKNMCWELVDKVGRICNLLKNRPWSQSNYLVSLLDFEKRLKDLWIYFWTFIKNLSIDKELLFDMVERKIEVNQHRIETGY